MNNVACALSDLMHMFRLLVGSPSDKVSCEIMKYCIQFYSVLR